MDGLAALKSLSHPFSMERITVSQFKSALDAGQQNLKPKATTQTA